MGDMQINYLAVLVSAVVSMVIGGLWYSPVLFGKQWMALMGMPEKPPENFNPAPLYAQAFVASLVCYYVLARLIVATGHTTAMEGLISGFWVWLGFIATVQFTGNLFSMKPIKLFYLETSYQLVCTLIAGMIIALWR
ncbi:MAG: DUF1761 domain-containing protein [Bacteroidota bacterium]